MATSIRWRKLLRLNSIGVIRAMNITKFTAAYDVIMGLGFRSENMLNKIKTIRKYLPRKTKDEGNIEELK